MKNTINSRDDIDNEAIQILDTIKEKLSKGEELDKTSHEISKFIENIILYYDINKCLDDWEMVNLLRSIQWLYNFNHSFIKTLSICLFDILDANNLEEKEKNKNSPHLLRVKNETSLDKELLMDLLKRAR